MVRLTDTPNCFAGSTAVQADLFIRIEYDVNGKPLIDALVSAGIPLNQIVLAYAGEIAEEDRMVEKSTHSSIMRRDDNRGRCL